MYQLMIRREFVAQHYLTIPDCGAENEWHSHHFTAEILLEGKRLNDNGYLVDIVEANAIADELIDQFRDVTLNDLPEFDGLNPSIEHFSRIFCEAFAVQLEAPNVEAIKTKIWEDDTAWASYRLTRSNS